MGFISNIVCGHSSFAFFLPIVVVDVCAFGNDGTAKPAIDGHVGRSIDANCKEQHKEAETNNNKGQVSTTKGKLSSNIPLQPSSHHI
jgi:hypothetical protein